MFVQNMKHTLIMGSILTSTVCDYINLKTFSPINTELHDNYELIT